MSAAWHPDHEYTNNPDAEGATGTIVYHSSTKGGKHDQVSKSTTKYLEECPFGKHRQNGRCAEIGNVSYVKETKDGVWSEGDPTKATWALAGVYPGNGNPIMTPCLEDENGVGCSDHLGNAVCIQKRGSVQGCGLRIPDKNQKSKESKPSVKTSKKKSSKKTPAMKKGIGKKTSTNTKHVAISTSKNPTAKKPATTKKPAANKKPATTKKPAANKKPAT